MARKRKKQTKQDLINKQYDREYTNYLARVRRLENQGVLVSRKKRVKKPTEASIRVLRNLTSKAIYEKSSVVEYATGLKITPNELGRKKAREANRIWVMLTPEMQDYARLNLISEPKELKLLKVKGVPQGGVAPEADYEMIIDNWYESLNQFTDEASNFLKEKTDALLREVGGDEKGRAKFAYTIKKHPDIMPEPPYIDEQNVNAWGVEILTEMGLVENTQEFADFLEKNGIVEKEKEW